MASRNPFASLVTGVVTAALVFAGCASQAPAADEAITIVLPEAPRQLEPCSAVVSDVGRVVKQNINETLTEVDPNDSSVRPRLATSWTQVDADTWRFELRTGVKFHDGADFTADAVVHSISRLMNEKIECTGRAKALAGRVFTATAVDADTVEVSADAPVPILPTMMANVVIVSPNTPANEPTRTPVGTGPYKLASWTPEAVVLERFDGYWGEKPPIAKATYVFRAESAVRAAMITRGEADLAPAIAAQDATDPKLDFAYFDSETTRFRIDATMAPLDDLRVRQALNLAIDRASLRGTIFPKDAEPATQLIVPAISGHNPDIPVWKYDPEEAKRLLADAKADGVAVDTKIHIIGRIGIYPNATEAAEALMAMWKDVGFDMDLTMLEVGEWFKYQEKPYPEDRGPNLLQEMVDNNLGDAVFTVFNKYHSDGATSAFDDPALDQIIDDAQAATGDERRDLWRQAFKMIEQDLVLEVPLFHMVGYTRVGDRIDWKPSLSTNSEIQIATMKLKS